MVPNDVYRALEDALGPENVSQELGVIDGYSWQPALNLGYDAWTPRAEAVVMPQSTEEVQAIVKICNRFGLKFKAFSTGWASWGSPGGPGVIQVDLRRMNRIIDIDEKNMYAIVEPYVCGSQMQAEAMKRGLNTHLIGAGPNCSQLANATSGWGYGWTGLYTGFSGRNPLGVEWVLPDGEVLKIGTPGSNGRWFSGDGPGPSLRGIMRGWGGAQGGLGIFTKCAIKLYSWPGEAREPRLKGTLTDIKGEVPSTHKVYFLFSPSYERFADLAYAIGNAEIGYIHCKGAVGAMFGLLAPRAMKKLLANPVVRTLIQAFQHMTLFALACHTPREFAYQEKVLREILDQTDSVMIDSSVLPFHAAFWWGVHRSIFPAMAFRPGGDFLTSMGSNEAYDCSVKNAIESEKLKREYIDKGVFFEDMADCTWGGIYEGTSNWGHLEQIGMFDRRGKQSQQGRFDYLDDTMKPTIDKSLAFGLSCLGFDLWKVFGPRMFNYHLWQSKIKQAFDPNNLADASFYIPPYDQVCADAAAKSEGNDNDAVPASPAP
ncbi:MAG TPA: FAD-binding oxidoreductase [Deltaproteobacteria bacterium]|nr:FAD-binding oxidoreductase [Deltaproteobacteria bacterium]